MRKLDNILHFNEKVILITGASSGIGSDLARLCGSLGAQLILCGRNVERLNMVSDEIVENGGIVLQKYFGDLTDSDFLKEVSESIPVIHGLALNAGINYISTVKTLNLKALHHVMEVNTYSPIMLMKMILKAKKFSSTASVVFTSSIAGFQRSSMGNSIYSTSKAALHGFMRNAALELASSGIRVNSVNPGMVETELLGKNGITQEQYDLDRKTYPLGRYGKPRDVSNAIAFLLSDASSWITGTAMVVDGGVTLR